LDASSIQEVRFCAPVFCPLHIIADALQLQPHARKQALFDLTKHAGFRPSNPREEHFVPLYIAAGAGQDGGAKVLAALYGAPTIAFGL